MLTIQPDRLDLQPGDRVLDLGCGRGRHVYALYWGETPVHVVGADLSESEVHATANGFFELPPPPESPDRSASLTAADAAKLPFTDGSFDAVICSEVLEHVPDPQAALAEIVRVTRPGGQVALSVPRWWPEKICWSLSPEYSQTPGGHVRIFRERQLRDAAERTGLAIDARHWAHALHSPYWWLQCALWRNRDSSRRVALYRRFLEWDLLKRPLLTRVLEALLNPVMGKSLVLYFTRPAA
ncbi:class I SAM-dependent methyltransferase [Hyphobacterium marinum]|uniref:Methyltransferase domain-containing protein n=1 Tax=Hyphobacterium marinum TaxID=3116574 RepID=A0ABU7M0Q4_9PROT|nr:methyltransferase domain-containing protein [Hyphobacterium sp. Y6023]MEE2566980.1 methyltransferase domain-containing protein [Hyphobacterium sp. Y6023]